MATTYANMLDSLQSTVWSILNNDSTVSTYTLNVLDGMPTALTRGTGYPYILVHTPSTSESQLALNDQKRMASLTILVEVWAKQESNVRKLVDAVRNAIRTNASSLRSVKFRLSQVEPTRINYVELNDNTYVYNMNIEFSFRCVI